MRIGIVGARLAGSYAALLLAQQRHEVRIFDDTTAREKPCGGGVTPKALRTVSWFRENPLPHTEIRALRLVSRRHGTEGAVGLKHPIRIFSRFTLDTALREAACRAGAQFLPARVRSFARGPKAWELRTDSGICELDFLVGADGANGSVRKVLGSKYCTEDLSLALGYYLPGLHHPDTVVAAFEELGFLGYIWSFPRVDHSSVGILRWLPHANAADLRSRVEEFIAARYPGATDGKSFYAARIPCLSRARLMGQRVCGQSWALLGDAAGFADAITAEGIHYALRSAELLARAFAAGEPERYEALWRDDFGCELERAARWRDRFYAGTLLFQSFIHRAIQLTRRSRTLQHLTDQLIAGKSSYGRLRWQMICHTPRVLVEALCNSVLVSGRPVDSAQAS